MCPDLRGYGDSSKPPGSADHNNYSKREMARDMVEVMAALGFERFALVGHDRGARVAHRLALDHRRGSARLRDGHRADAAHVRAHRPGFRHRLLPLVLPDPARRPAERMIGADPGWFLARSCAAGGARCAFRRSGGGGIRALLFAARGQSMPVARTTARRLASTSSTTAPISAGKRIACPLLVLWGERGFVSRSYDVLTVWQQYADDVRGAPVRVVIFCRKNHPTRCCGICSPSSDKP